MAALGQTRDTSGRYQEMLLADPGQLALDSGQLDLGSAMEGTFEFPPFLPDAAHIIQFWTGVEVPEEVLVSTQAAHANRDRMLLEEMRPKYDKVSRYPMYGSEDVKERWLDERYAWLRDRVPFPEAIPNLWARPLVRLAKMHESAQLLTETRPGDVQQVCDLMVTFPGGQRRSVQQWVDMFGMIDLLPHIQDYRRWVAASAAVRGDPEPE